jgi:hypothetical protein
MTCVPMDHTAATKRPSNARVHKYLPYLAHQIGYQRFKEIYSAQVSRCSTYIHTNRNGISRHLVLRRDLPLCRQNRAEAQTKYVTICAWEHLTTKSRKGWPQTTDKIWKVSGQPIEAASKEGHQKDKERYWEVV